MKILLVTLLGLVLNMSLLSQSKREIITMAKGDTVAFLMTIPPASTEGFYVYRKGPLPTSDDYVLLTNENPIKPIINSSEAQAILGDDYIYISKALKTETPFETMRRLRGNDFEGGLLSLLFTSVARVTGRWFIDTTAQSGKEYDYKFSIINASGKEIQSINSKILVKSVLPSAPGDLKAEEMDENLKLTWEYPKWENDFTNLCVRYNVYRKTGKEPFQKINSKIILRDEAVEPEFIDVWLQNGQEYSYYVTAVDPLGRESKASNIIKATPKDAVAPVVPEIVNAQVIGNKITISWGMSLEIDAAGYNIFRSTGLDKEPNKINKTQIPLEHNYFVDSLIASGVQYFYFVNAVDKNKNESVKSNAFSVIAEDKAKPEPPSNLSYKLDKGVLRLIWKASVSKDVLGYNIYRGEALNLTPRINENAIKVTAYEDNGYKGVGLLQGRVFFYSISAIDSSQNESDKISLSVVVPDNEPPLAPINFSIKNLDGLYIEITCGLSPSSDAVQYNIYKSENGKLPSVAYKIKSGSLVVLDSSVVKGKNYKYYATALDTAGNESKPTNTEVISFVDYSPPPIIPEVTISKKEQGVLLEWQEVIDFDLEGYYVLRSTVANGNYEKVNTTPIKETKFIDPSGGKQYFYKVVSVDTSGNISDAETFVYLP